MNEKRYGLCCTKELKERFKIEPTKAFEPMDVLIVEYDVKRVIKLTEQVFEKFMIDGHLKNINIKDIFKELEGKEND